MPIVVNLNVVLAKRKRTLTDLSKAVGVSLPNLSALNAGRGRAIRFSTLDAICNALECQPGEILEHMSEGDFEKLMGHKYVPYKEPKL